MLFASIALREWGKAALWPARVFGVLAAAPIFTGLYAYSLGLHRDARGAQALQARRLWLALVFAALTVGFSPLAFAFLCLILAAFAVAQRRLSRRTLARRRPRRRGAVELRARPLPEPRHLPVPLRSTSSRCSACRRSARCSRAARGAGRRSSRSSCSGGSAASSSTSSRPRSATTGRGSARSCSRSCCSPRASPASGRGGSSSLALAAAFAYNLVPYFMLIPYRLDNRPAAGGVLAARDPVPARAREPELPRRGRADRRALGVVLAPDAPVSRSRAAGSGRSTWSTTRALREAPAAGDLPRLAPRERRPLRPPARDAARLGRRAAGGALRRGARACTSSSASPTGRSTSCRTRRRSSPARRRS